MSTTSAENETSSTHECHAVSVKLPPFWPDNIEAWFSQIESQFRTKKIIAELTKFDYVVQALSQTEVVKVLDLVQSPPPLVPYSTLKKRLLSLHAMTEYARYEALVGLPMSGDMLPSTLMSKMLSLLPPDTKPCWIFRSIFLHRLPADIRIHLVDNSAEDSLQLALRADRLLKSRLHTPLPTVNAVSDDPEPMYAIRQPPRSSTPRRPATSSANNRRSATPRHRASSSRRSESPDLCWYHHNFAEAASKCRAPCSWSGN